MIKQIQGGVCAAKGWSASGIYCGIRSNKNKLDLALVYSSTLASVACTYTTNKVKGAPLYVTQKNVANGQAQAIICNSGNANTCNANGIEIAQAMCELTAKELGIKASDVVVASTGVIGAELHITPIKNGLPQLVAELSTNGHLRSCQAIMTTDTFSKEIAVEFNLGDKICHLGGMAKGSGMININMATMLCFLTSDVKITSALLQKALSEVVADTLNMVCVDGDTSTNDMAVILSNGLADNELIATENEDYQVFKTALFEVLNYLSALLAKDGEGATKQLICHVLQAPSILIARAIAKNVIASDLLKAAMFGKDANWGRILCAIGYTEGDFSIANISVTLSSKAGELLVCQYSFGVKFDEDLALKVLAEDSITIQINLHNGNHSAVAYGCDLTYDYVKINGDYRT